MITEKTFKLDFCIQNCNAMSMASESNERMLFYLDILGVYSDETHFKIANRPSPIHRKEITLS